MSATAVVMFGCRDVTALKSLIWVCAAPVGQNSGIGDHECDWSVGEFPV